MGLELVYNHLRLVSKIRKKVLGYQSVSVIVSRVRYSIRGYICEIYIAIIDCWEIANISYTCLGSWFSIGSESSLVCYQVVSLQYTLD